MSKWKKRSSKKLRPEPDKRHDSCMVWIEISEKNPRFLFLDILTKKCPGQETTHQQKKNHFKKKFSKIELSTVVRLTLYLLRSFSGCPMKLPSPVIGWSWRFFFLSCLSCDEFLLKWTGVESMLTETWCVHHNTKFKEMLFEASFDKKAKE